MVESTKASEEIGMRTHLFYNNLILQEQTHSCKKGINPCQQPSHLPTVPCGNHICTCVSKGTNHIASGGTDLKLEPSELEENSSVWL
jgi:hypothetical protein